MSEIFAVKSTREIFSVKTEWGKMFADLNAEQKASLFDAMFAYHNGEGIPRLSPVWAMGFNVMRAFFDKSAADYYSDLF